MKKTHIGVVGAGAIAHEHAISLERQKLVAGLSVYDADAARASAFAKRFNARVASSLADLAGGCDLVWVCTPPFAHREPVLAACKAGKPVFCEKPLAHRQADADAIALSVRRSGVPLFMGHSGRYTTAFIKMKQLAVSGAIGSVTGVWSTRLGYLNPKTAAPWRLDDKLSGGVAVELAIHELDWCRWIGGEWISVSAVDSSRTIAPGKFQDTITGVGTLAGSGRRADPVIAKVEVSWANPRYLWQRGIEGTTGSLFYDDCRFNEVQLLRPGAKPRIITVKPDWWKDEKTGENFAFRDQASAVLSALAKGKRPPVVIEDGIASLRAALAMRKSARTGKVVKV